MGVITNLFERRSGSFSISDNLDDNHWFLRWVGHRSAAGVTVNEHTALNSLMVVTCVSILADTFASVPLPVYRRLERGRDTARNHPLYRVLHDEPNADMSSFTWRHVVMVHLATWGNHYSEIVRDRGEVAELRPFHPSEVRLEDRNGQGLVYIVRNNERVIPARNMLHIRGLSTRGYLGLSPLGMMRQAVGIAVAAEEYGARFFANDARPHILLKHPGVLGEEGRKNLTDSWKEDHGGRNRGGVAVLEEGMEVETISIPPEDAQFIQTRQFEARQTAGFYRIPPHLISDVDRSTSWGTGIEQQQIGFTIYTMTPWFVRFEQEVQRQLFPPEERGTYYAEFNMDGLVRGDLAARTEHYRQMWMIGAYSHNHILEKENMNPVEGGDRRFVPLNMVPLDSVDEEPDEDSAPDDEEPQEDSGPNDDEEPRGRERRSATSRRRIANSYRPVFEDVARRLLRIEANEIRRAINRNLTGRSVESFEAWVKEFYYESFPPRIAEAMLPPVRSLMEAVAAVAAEEVGGEPPEAEDLDVFAREYVDVYAARHAGTSRSRLLARVNDHRSAETRQDEELVEDLDELLEDWEERASEIAEDETHRGSNATARTVFTLLGVIALRWVAAGSKPCEFCQAMDGRITNIDSAFLAAGNALSIEGLAPFVSRTSIGHPPLHSGCQCVIVPA